MNRRVLAVALASLLSAAPVLAEGASPRPASPTEPAASPEGASPRRPCDAAVACPAGQRCEVGACVGEVLQAPPAPQWLAVPPPSLGPGVLQPPQLEGRELKRFLRDWREGDPVPNGYHPGYRPRLGLVISGGLMLVVPYALQVAGFSEAGFSAEREPLLYVPVVGMLYFGGTIFSEAVGWRGSDGLTNAFVGIFGGVIGVAFIFVGLVQAAGLALLVAGLVGKTELIEDEPGITALVPFFTPGGGGGLGLVGRF